MKIKTTGIEQWMPGGEANMKIMVIGGPGVGKTRWSSFWPEPFYLNCEDGLASVADRQVPYIDIVEDEEGPPSEKMLNALRWLKSHPNAKKYGTVVVDTLDAYQRKIKQEWLEQNKNEPTFTGYDAWGYLDAKMQALMTRLISLDKNVIVLVHYKDKEVDGRDDNGAKTKETITQLQLQGDSKDTAFNDFDLVGWMDTFWKAGSEEEGGRVEARGITFSRTPQRPFLKDRLHITPKWLEIDFSESDYTNLFSRFIDKLDDLAESGEVGEVDIMPAEGPTRSDGVVDPLKGGAVAPQDPREMPLDQLTKAELVKLAQDYPEADVKTSMLKAEIVDAIAAARAKKKDPDPDNEGKAAEEAIAAESKPADDASSSSDQEEAETAPEEPDTDSTPVQAEDVDETPEEEAVDPETLIKEELGGEVISETPAPDATETEAAEPPPPVPAASEKNPLSGKECEECGKDLAGENPDYVKLGFIKFRKYLCNEDYKAAKKG